MPTITEDLKARKVRLEQDVEDSSLALKQAYKEQQLSNDWVKKMKIKHAESIIELHNFEKEHENHKI